MCAVPPILACRNVRNPRAIGYGCYNEGNENSSGLDFICSKFNRFFFFAARDQLFVFVEF